MSTDEASRRMHDAYDLAWGEEYRVFHWGLRELPHVDVFCLHREAGETLLATAGMSTRELPGGPGRGERRVELFVRVRPGLAEDDDRALATGLRVLAMSPFRGDFALGVGHTVCDPTWSRAGRQALLGNWLLAAPDRSMAWVAALERELEGVTVLEAVPLWPAEGRMAQEHGAEPILALVRGVHGPLTWPGRPSVAQSDR
jgi:hypothetical protein